MWPMKRPLVFLRKGHVDEMVLKISAFVGVAIIEATDVPVLY